MMVAIHGTAENSPPSYVMDLGDESLDASMDNGENDRSCASMDSSEYQGSLDADLADLDIRGKRYFCQRCLNHGLEYQRKGHKPRCTYATCQCELCMMVEQRRQINYQLSIRKPDDSCDVLIYGKKIRNPQCARCSAHGKKQALRGHKKTTCPYNNCQCEMCALVENRRNLMARQIRVRRKQQKQRQKQTSEDVPEPAESPVKTIAKPLPRVLPLPDDLIVPFKRNPPKKKIQKRLLGIVGQSAFQPTVPSQSSEISSVASSVTPTSLFPALFTGALVSPQLEAFMRLCIQASQQPPQPSQQVQLSAPVSSINPFLMNHQASSSFLPNLGTTFGQLPPSMCTNFQPTIPTMVNPYILPCFQGFSMPSTLPFQPFLSVDRSS